MRVKPLGLTQRKVQVSVGGGVRRRLTPDGAGMATVARGGGTMEMELPIPTFDAAVKPKERTEFLLHTAVEIEHVLLVQYLYAALKMTKW